MEWNEGFFIEADGHFATARLLPRPPCGFCGETGRRIMEMDGVSRVARCRCQKLPDRIDLFNHVRIPAKYARCTMENFKTELDGTRPGWLYVRGWLDRYKPGKENPSLIIYGKPGRGKTHLLCGALRELVFRHGVACRFVEFTHLLSDLRDAIGRRSTEETTLMPLVRTPVLAIDELGKGRRTDFEMSVIDEIITRRYNARATILATTNFPLQREGQASSSLATGDAETLAERLGDRVFSRLKETSAFVPAMGEDFRVVRR